MYCDFNLLKDLTPSPKEPFQEEHRKRQKTPKTVFIVTDRSTDFAPYGKDFRVQSRL